MPDQKSQLDPDTYVLMLFKKTQKFSKRGGCETVEAFKGEQHEVPEQHVSWLEDIKAAVPVSGVEKIEVEEAAEVIDPSTGKPIEEVEEKESMEDDPEIKALRGGGSEESKEEEKEEEEEEEVEVNDLTTLHKIGKVTQEKLYEKGIYTFEHYQAFIGTEDGIKWLVDQKGITEEHISRMQHNINEVMTEG